MHTSNCNQQTRANGSDVSHAYSIDNMSLVHLVDSCVKPQFRAKSWVRIVYCSYTPLTEYIVHYRNSSISLIAMSWKPFYFYWNRWTWYLWLKVLSCSLLWTFIISHLVKNCESEIFQWSIPTRFGIFLFSNVQFDQTGRQCLAGNSLREHNTSQRD